MKYNMKKNQLEKTILTDGRSCSQFSDNRYSWGEIVQILKDEHITLQDTDILSVGFTEGWQDGDSARDDYYDLKVIRVREETEKEAQNRIDEAIRRKEHQRNTRYTTYLKSVASTKVAPPADAIFISTQLLFINISISPTAPA